MSNLHHQEDVTRVSCAVITVSDTRSEENDISGQRIKTLLQEADHEIIEYNILPDEPKQLRRHIEQLAEMGHCQALLINGGTGLTARDSTYEVVTDLFEKQIEGFGELFRQLSYNDIGPKAMLSRATAGIYKRMVIFSMPGSPPAVELAVSRLILPTLSHTAALTLKDA